jgi:hypothetical protein
VTTDDGHAEQLVVLAEMALSAARQALELAELAETAAVEATRLARVVVSDAQVVYAATLRGR